MNKKTSDELSLGVIDGTELVRVAKGGQNYKTTLADIAAYAGVGGAAGLPTVLGINATTGAHDIFLSNNGGGVVTQKISDGFGAGSYYQFANSGLDVYVFAAFDLRLWGDANVNIHASAGSVDILGVATTINTGAFTITATSTILNSLTASRALVLNASKAITVSATTDTELGYLSGVTSAVQAQLNAKQTSYTILSTLGALADAAGVLTNNGAGVLSWGSAGGGITVGTTTITSGTSGRIAFNNAGVYGENANLFWDNSNFRLGLLQGTPLSALHLNKDQNSVTQNDANGILLANATAATVGLQSISPAIVLQGKGWKTNATAGSQDVRFRIDVLPVQGAANPTSTLQFASSINGGAYTLPMKITSVGDMTLTGVLAATSGTFSLTSAALVLGGNNAQYRTTNAGGTLMAESCFDASGNNSPAGNLHLVYDATNQLGFAASNGTRRILRANIGIINLTNTAGSEAGDLSFSTQSGGTAATEKFRITSVGGFVVNATNTTVGTTGNQTINKPSGTVNIAAAGTTVVVTNSLVTTSSLVFCDIRTNDTTARITSVVPAAGSFTINIVACTAEVSIGFWVIN